MNNLRKLFFSSAVILPVAALAITGVHAATTTIDQNTTVKHPFLEKMNLTDAQKTAVEQADALRKQADDILVKAGIPMHRRGNMMRVQLTDEQKITLEQANALRKDGKNDEAKALLEKAGLPIMKPMFHRGTGGKR